MKKTTKNVHEFLCSIDKWLHEQKDRSAVVFLCEGHEDGPEFGCRIGGVGQAMFETIVYTMMEKAEVREFLYAAVAATEKLLAGGQGETRNDNAPTLN